MQLSGEEGAGFRSPVGSGQAGSWEGDRRVPREEYALPQCLKGTLGVQALLTFPVLRWDYN